MVDQSKSQGADAGVEFGDAGFGGEFGQAGECGGDDGGLALRAGLQEGAGWGFDGRAGEGDDRRVQDDDGLGLGFVLRHTDAGCVVGAGEGDDFAPVRAGERGIGAEQNIGAVVEEVDDDRSGAAEGFQAAEQDSERWQEGDDAGVEEDAFPHVDDGFAAGFVQAKGDGGADAGGGKVSAAAGLEWGFDEGEDKWVFIAGADEGVA